MTVVIEQALAAAIGQQRHIFDLHCQILQEPELAAGERPQVSAATGGQLRGQVTGGLETGRIWCSKD